MVWVSIHNLTCTSYHCYCISYCSQALFLNLFLLLFCIENFLVTFLSSTPPPFLLKKKTKKQKLMFETSAAIVVVRYSDHPPSLRPSGVFAAK